MKEDIVKKKYSVYVILNNFGHIEHVTISEYEALLIKLKSLYEIDGMSGVKRIYKKNIFIKIHQEEQINLL